MGHALRAPGFAPAATATDRRPLIVVIIATLGLNVGIVVVGCVVSMLILQAL